ncbi:hypothetical protein [Pedobacter duraquae]|uniref:Uncharacterized protein n=1 Tax=Pedobacter duraquae TaxID=425511 RepID=A0A4R6IK89_9SPHI|nr:hypothetical protein [Pedobacter duraquae]TDO22365.1 hypothetical protein CLV32_1334 [Pedobacter duraquae]
MKINALSPKDISGLKPDQLIDLLEKLLSLETSKVYLPSEINSLSVPKALTVKDGGEDAKIALDISIADNRLVGSQWIKNPVTVFQSKASKMSPDDCYKEVIIPRKRGQKGKKELQPKIKECLDKAGEYILFTTDELVPTSIDLRIKAIKRAFNESGIADTDAIKVRILDANQISRWCNEHLSSIILVQSFKGIQRLGTFSVWSDWNKIFRKQKKYEYQESTSLKSNTQLLFDALHKKGIARVIGHKGLGKTRFVLESFNPSNSQLAEVLSSSVVYIDLAIASPTDLTTFILNHGHLEGIIVIDNCSDEWHNNYSPLIRVASGLKMITINDSNENLKNEYIVLDRKGQGEVVLMMFRNCFPGLSESEVKHFVEISEGFPEMVSFIDDAIKNNSSQVVLNTLPKDFVNKFLFPDNIDAAEYDLFKACSVFTEFGFYDDKIDDIIFDRERKKLELQNVLIYTQIAKIPQTKSAFYKFCTKYRDKRSLLEKRGYYHSVIPEPIAATLAAEWWEETSFDFVYTVLQELKESELLIPMMDRLSNMDQSDRAKNIVSKAWGPSGPFSTAEVLNTELGSRLFRSVVVVNPIATADALSYTYEEFSIQELKEKVRSGRRNIIWALEKLTFRATTFNSSVKMLMRLAAAENETFANNATGQLLQLFHIQLAGTEANLKMRTEVIKWGLKQSDREVNEIAILAGKHGLKSSGFHRTIGAENQGLSSPLKDYQPGTWKEIFEYWEEILEVFTLALEEDKSLIDSVKSAVASSIRSMFENGQGMVIKKSIEKILSVDENLWIDAINNLKRTVDWDKLGEKDRVIAEELLQKLRPLNIGSKLKLIVVTPEWGYRKGDNREEDNQTKAKLYALEFVNEPTLLIPYLKILLEGEQRQAFNFGVSLASSTYIEILLPKILSQLAEIPEPDQNPSFLAGIISQLSVEMQRKVIDDMLSNKGAIKHIFHIIRLINPSKDEVFKLFDLVDNKEVNINSFQSFQYGKFLDQFDNKDVLQLCEKIASYGKEGVWTAFLLITQYYYDDDDKWLTTRDFIRSIMTDYNVLNDFDFAPHVEDYGWYLAMKKLLDNTGDLEFAENISNQIVSASYKEGFPYFEESLREIAEILCTQYFKIFWLRSSEGLLSDTISFLNLKTLLGVKNGVFGYSGILFNGDQTEIIKWCIENNPKGAYRIAYMMPLFGEDTWTDFALSMIDEFGEDQKFLDEIASNLGSFGMVGSSENYYLKVIKMAGDLSDHRIPKVRKWAKNCIIHYNKNIRRDKLDEENRA